MLMTAPRRLTALSLVVAALLPACAGSAPEPVKTVESDANSVPTVAPSAAPTSSVNAEAWKIPEGGAAKRPVINEYHGTTVTDDYQWLEDKESPEVKEWVAAHNKRSRAYFDASPEREAIHKRFTELITAASGNRFGLSSRGGKIFALKFQPPKQQVLLVTMKSVDDVASERPLVDPNQLDAKGKTTIDFYRASRDGKKVAVSLSKDGTEDGTVFIY